MKLGVALLACADLMAFDGLDHQLSDSDARTQMLRKSESFSTGQSVTVADGRVTA